MKKAISFLLILVALVACESQVQTTSGRDYLTKNEQALQHNMVDSKEFQDALKKAAAVEPALKFPARIGVARVENGRITTPTGKEVASWQQMQKDLGEAFGEVVIINPLIAESVASQSLEAYSTLQKIRLGAARQHVDAVIVYEVYSNAEENRNLATVISHLTIIGAYILPTDAVNAEASASAIMIDVMQAYPYGSVSTIVEKDKTYSASNNAVEDGQNLKEKLASQATEKLTVEVKDMLQKLMQQLTAKKN